MATLLITLQSRKKKNGTYPVVVMIRHDNSFFDIPTGIDVLKTQFDAVHGQILGDKSLIQIKLHTSLSVNEYSSDFGLDASTSLSTGDR